ncbi:MAG: hypothetical protein J1G02_02960 [Clostridiales bacterium]|nr:hypothetical protein [Clostridiales bacterium]
MKKAKLTKVVSVAVNIIIYLFCALCLLLLVFTIAGKRDTDGAVNMFGYQMRIVLTGSMEAHPDVDVSDYKIKSLKTGSMVFIKTVPDDENKAEEFYSDLKVGDVLTFRYLIGSRQETITHRIIDIKQKDTSGYVITLRGDNLSSSGATGVQTIDTGNESSLNYVVGKVTGKSYVLGWIAYSLKQPIGIALVIIVPCSIIIIWNVIKIVNAVNAKKLEQQAIENESEMNALKRRISELEQSDKDK